MRAAWNKTTLRSYRVSPYDFQHRFTPSLQACRQTEANHPNQLDVDTLNDQAYTARQETQGKLFKLPTRRIQTIT